MKKVILLVVTVVCTVSAGFAQNYDEVKNMLYLRNYSKAKEALDKNWSNAKFTSKPEAYILKSSVLAGLSGDSSKAAESKDLRAQSMEAFNKYREMDPKMTALVETGSAYSNTPIILYGGYFNDGIGYYKEKKWPEAFTSFKSAVELSDFLRENKLADIKLDTNGLLLAGASAQSMKNDEEAAKYFSRLAEGKVGGPENEFLYQFLANRSLQKSDMVSFNKYLALGKELYPESKYFQYDELDYILALENEAEKIKLIDKKIAENPNDYKVQSAYGDMLFEKLNPKDTSISMPANYDELEGKMVAAYTKATELKPESGLAMSNLGNHFINKANRTGKELDALKTSLREKNMAIKASAKPGAKPIPPAKPDPEYIAKRDALQKEYDDAANEAIVYYGKAVNIYSKLSTPTLIEKQQYRNAVSYLIDLSAEKKNNNKATPALYDKWENEEKKWSDIYHKM